MGGLHPHRAHGGRGEVDLDIVFLGAEVRPAAVVDAHGDLARPLGVVGGVGREGREKQQQADRCEMRDFERQDEFTLLQTAATICVDAPRRNGLLRAVEVAGRRNLRYATGQTEPVSLSQRGG